MPKVAFLSLNYSSFSQQELMKQFFSPEDKDKYNLYIHNKTPVEDEYIKQHCIPEDYKVETEWGKYSLVLATIRLMKYALLDPENEKFILISNSHCPLYPIDIVCKKLFDDYPILSFDRSIVCSRDPTTHRFNRLIDPRKHSVSPFKLESALFVAQWFICNRSDAEFYVKNEARLRSWFNHQKTINPDEMYFSLLANHYGLPYQIKTNCYVAWDEETEPHLVQQGHRLTPKTFDKINNKMIDILREKDMLFMRKIYDDTELNINYILNK